MRLRDSPDVLDTYVTQVSDVSGIPSAHVEKDYWVTEVLRGVARSSEEQGVFVVFKGGTSLSKAYKLIRRFSEDVDILVVVDGWSHAQRDAALKAIVAAAAEATGLEPELDRSTAKRGVNRAVTLEYGAVHSGGGLGQRVLLELGSYGGAIPHRLLPVRSLLAEYAEGADLPNDFDEAAPISLPVLEPVRTLVEKMLILHDAAKRPHADRQRRTARHYYDVDRLLRSDDVRARLVEANVAVLAREICNSSKAAGLSFAPRPKGGFAASPAWDPTRVAPARKVYEEVVLPTLVWPGAERSTFEECCQLVHELTHEL